MKRPLSYQITEFDCAKASLENAFSYLFEREELPPEILKFINSYTMDLNDEFGNFGQGGTSHIAIENLVNLLNEYIVSNKFKVICECLKNEEVTLEKMINCLNNKGVCLIRCWQCVEHYVIIVQIKKKWIYIFDPYYLKKKKYKDNEFKIILNKPFKYNRKVTLKRLFSTSKKDFSLGNTNRRQCILIKRISDSK